MENRKHNRLACYNYSSPGYYFITICTKDRDCFFGDIKNKKMLLNKYGELLKKFWDEIPKHYENVNTDAFQIMPNHIHGIIIILPVGATIGRPFQKAGNARPYTDLHKIIGSYKNVTSKNIHAFGLKEFEWQKSFYDHVIRKNESLEKIREYIFNNPAKWELDQENPLYLKALHYNSRPKPFGL